MTEKQSKVTVYLVRHGERLDEVERGWVHENQERWFDPPLTAIGCEQAANAATHMLQIHEQKPFPLIHCSPLLRTVMTANEFSKTLKLPVSLVRGLGQCAAAVKQHGERLKYYGEEEIRSFCPEMSFRHSDKPLMKFEVALEQACLEAHLSGHSHILVVTHREGIYSMMKLCGEALRRANYCAIATFEAVFAQPQPRGGKKTETSKECGHAANGAANEAANGNSNADASVDVGAQAMKNKIACSWTMVSLKQTVGGNLV